MYKLVVCDIDGTLINKKGNLTEKTIETINEIRSLGIKVTLCTGRNIGKTIPIAKKLNLDIPFICIDGIILVDPISKKPVIEKTINRNELEKLVALGERNKVYIEATDGYKYYKYFPTKEYRRYDFFNNFSFKGRVKSWFGNIRYLKNPKDFLNIKGTIYQMVLAGEVEKTSAIIKEFSNLELENMEIRDFLWDEYLFVNYKGIGKAHGVELLCNHLKIDKEEVVAFGDQKNDLDMLEYVGLGVAMGNALDEVKSVSKDVTLSNEEDGVAYYLEKLFLNK